MSTETPDWPVWRNREVTDQIRELAGYISKTEYEPFLEHYCENASSSDKETLARWIYGGRHIYALYVLIACNNQQEFSNLIDALHIELLDYIDKYDIIFEDK
jgi:hypothetical protein